MQNNKYKITFSVITPTHNRCYVLWKSIQSVLSQTYPFFELLIIDDGSTDKTQKLIAEFNDPRLKYFKLSKNSGPAKARNFGLKKAKGEYVAYLDSDNEWHKDFLMTMNNGFQKYPEKILLFCKKNYKLTLIDSKGDEQSVRDEFSNHKKYFDVKRLWHRKILIDTNTMCHKKQEIQKKRGWNEELGIWEDWELTLRISEKYPDGFLYLNKALLDYEQKIDLSKAEKIFDFWEQEEQKIFNKYKNNPLLDGQNWFPPKKGNKSTLGVIEYLRNKQQK